MDDRDDHPAIAPLFIRNGGCPGRCIYCSERLTDPEGGGCAPADLREAVVRHLGRSRRKSPAQIAFYGGSFTGLDPARREAYLQAAGACIREGLAVSIRISARPDQIDGTVLERLAAAGVATVEIGAESMDDEILARAGRGHGAADVVRAMGLLRRGGFETGIHLMAGLPGDTRERFAASVDRIADLHPDMVRIHPTVVLAETELAAMFGRGEYEPLSLEEAVRRCADAVSRFEAAGIRVARLGLQATAALERPGAIVAGPFHPSFGALVEAEIFRRMASALLAARGDGGDAAFRVSVRDVSSFRGTRNANIRLLKDGFGLRSLTVRGEAGRERGTVALEAAGVLFERKRGETGFDPSIASQDPGFPLSRE
ncbi:MAG: Oxygen-independent coproporphyrinogen-III oxidase 1 [Syntrophaceae bacterium PtaU1.Bin231]|nr:MAG: Oxygen-independent coproporphyrinogen-III oxidase 1 [Syntrophaceae bacterium PtaU1.Bin231]